MVFVCVSDPWQASITKESKNSILSCCKSSQKTFIFYLMKPAILSLSPTGSIKNKGFYSGVLVHEDASGRKHVRKVPTERHIKTKTINY